MKRLKIISTFIIIASLYACEPPNTFTEPQPTDTDNLSKFPKRLQGEYISLLDSSTLTINNELIQRSYELNYKIHPNQIDSTCILSSDTLIFLNTNERALIKRDGDSLVLYFHNIDTLFQMNNDHVVRKFKGYYFLNTHYDKANWTVKKLQLSKGQLVISGLSIKQDIETLKEITNTTEDTQASYNFTVTKRQFKKFIKNDGFSDSEKFIRLNTSTNTARVINNVNSVDEFIENENNFVIYPNPASNQLFIKREILVEQEFSIVNLLGEEIVSGTLNGQIENLDISSLSPNIYIIRIDNESIKFVKTE